MIVLFTYCFLSILMCSYTYGQEGMVHCSPLIDTNDVRIGPAVKIWLKYLHESPDSIQESPLWVMKDRNDRFSFDPARAWVFQTKEFIHSYPPTIIGAEEVAKGKVILKTLFQGIDSLGSSLPIAMYRVLARNIDDEWKLESVIESMTEEWNTKSIGGITFYMSPKHKYFAGY